MKDPRKSLRRLSVAVLIAALLLPGALFAADEIKIGVLFPLTGGAAAAGRELRSGAELAADIANNIMPDINMTMAKNAGIKSMGGAKITLIFKDHEGNPTLGADLAKKLILDDKVHGLMGAYHSSVTKAVSGVAEQYGVPLINDSSTSVELTRQGYKWFWRTTPHETYFTKDLFEFLKGLTEGKVKGVKAVPKKDILNLASACEKTEWGAGVSELIEKFSADYGFKVKKSILYGAKATDLSSEARSLIAVKPDAFLFAAYPSDAILMMKTLKEQKYSPKVLWGQNAGFEVPEFVNTLGDITNGVLTRTVFLPKVSQVKPVAAKINEMYKAKTGNDLSGASARSFTGLQAWVHVLEKAGSVKPEDIQKAANSIQIPAEELVVPWAGIKFSTSGEDIGQNVMGSGLIGQYQKGKDGKIDLEIVYPFNLATANMIYPFPKF
jgi:branched-chain amino acid transport system substrate-binding protein